jgi:hypothetical protein
MDNFLRLTDDNKKERGRKARVHLNPNVTPERIEKLKKSFQPFWMRGMIPHSKESHQNLGDNFNQV